FLFLPLFAIFFPTLRFFLNRLVFEHIGRHLIYNKRLTIGTNERNKRIIKFKESTWKFVYYLSAEILTLAVTYNEPWFSKTTNFWNGPGNQRWPDQKMKFARVGSVILLHDGTDVFLEVGKMSKYCGFKGVANFSFNLFVISWVVLRLIYFPFWILWSTSYEILQTLDFEKHAQLQIYYYIFNTLLVCLFVLHTYWWVLMYRTLVKQIQERGKLSDHFRSGRRLIYNKWLTIGTNERNKRIIKFKESAWKFVYYLSAEILTLAVKIKSRVHCRFARVGSVVLALHDGSDVFLEVGKMSKYCGFEGVAMLRLIYFPFWILWSTSYEVLQTWDLEKHAPELPIYYYIFNTLLFCLLVLHTYWWVLMYRMLVKQIQDRGKLSDDLQAQTIIIITIIIIMYIFIIAYASVLFHVKCNFVYVQCNFLVNVYSFFSLPYLTRSQFFFADSESDNEHED
ncbi:hypothetical protein M8C21_014873, partial [Ambrosia artemisiifolia]